LITLLGNGEELDTKCVADHLTAEVKFSHFLMEDGQRKHYSTFHRGSLEVKLNDFVYLTAPKDAPYFVAEVISIFEEDQTPMVTVRWLFRVGPYL